MEVGRSLGLTIHRNLERSNQLRNRALERISTGLRVNRSADDAAGLSISETLRTQVRGTQAAVKNCQDGINLLRTADGAFNGIHEMLQRMRELCVQGANGTLTLGDRSAIQEELEALKKEIDNTAYNTQFNGINLLADQDKLPRAVPTTFTYAAGAAPALYGAGTDALVATPVAGSSFSGVTFEEVRDVVNQLPYLLEGAMRKAEGMLFNSGLDLSAPTPTVRLVIDAANPNSFTRNNSGVLEINLVGILGAPAAGPQITLQQAVTQGVADLLMQREDGASGANGDYAAFFGLTGDMDNIRQLFTVGAAESYLGYGTPVPAFQFNALDGADGGRAASAWFSRYMVDNFGSAALQNISDLIINNDTGAKGAITASIDTYLQGLTGLASRAAVEAAVNTYIGDQVAAGNASTAGSTLALSNTAPTGAQLLFDNSMGPLADDPSQLQVGANAGETMDLKLYAGALGNLDFAGLVCVMDQATAGRSIATLDKAIFVASDARAKLGAQENRLEHTVNRLSSYLEAASASESRIRDADIAEEMTNYSREAILGQAAERALQDYHAFEREQAGTLLQGLG